jgi:hypothetical protein
MSVSMGDVDNNHWPMRTVSYFQEARRHAVSYAEVYVLRKTIVSCAVFMVTQVDASAKL